jgi:hypothetical protein
MIYYVFGMILFIGGFHFLGASISDPSKFKPYAEYYFTAIALGIVLMGLAFILYILEMYDTNKKIQELLEKDK